MNDFLEENLETDPFVQLSTTTTYDQQLGFHSQFYTINLYGLSYTRIGITSLEARQFISQI